MWDLLDAVDGFRHELHAELDGIALELKGTVVQEEDPTATMHFLTAKRMIPDDTVLLFFCCILVSV